MKTVIYLGALEGFEASKKVLEDIAVVKHVPAQLDKLMLALPEADSLLDASMKVQITDEMIKSAARLQIISCATTGSDHIERNALQDRDIPVRTLKEDAELLQNLTPAAELSWALLMACARRLPAAVRHVTAGGWSREEFPGIMLNGKNLGLVGCGRIGRWMAGYGNAFGMNVLGYDPYIKNWPDNIKPVSLEKLMESSEFISIHVHLTAETTGLISRNLLERVKKGTVLINTSRGPIVDDTALLDMLQSGRIHGVGLDVLTGEPDTSALPLVKYARNHDNVLITPHCGGYSPDAVRIVCKHASEKIRSLFLARDQT